MDHRAVLRDGQDTMNDQPIHHPPAYNHSYPTRYAYPAQLHSVQPTTEVSQSASHATKPGFRNTTSEDGKIVQFQLHRARLPLRVKINSHDTVEGIISTVKNFYGLYEGQGISFEDDLGITLIPQYENMTDNATVHVRVTQEQVECFDPQRRPSLSSTSPRKPHLEEPFQMLPPLQSRPNSRAAKKRSASPTSLRANNTFSRLQAASRARGVTQLDDDATNNLSDSDVGSVSVSSSRRAKMESLASADISLDNIVEGGRRKRAKFESSELPLFVPPQLPMTASLSSASPQRRQYPQSAPSPYHNQCNFSYNLPSPLSYSHADGSRAEITTGKNGDGLSDIHGTRAKYNSSVKQRSSRFSGNSHSFLPTPDPTIGSVISDEDVALQLMRLGDASNMSNGRTSTSTMDDALSGKAEMASSDEGSDNEATTHHLQQMESHAKSRMRRSSGPPSKKVKRSKQPAPESDGAESSEEESDGYNDDSFGIESDEAVPGHIGIKVEDARSKNRKPSKPHSGKGNSKGRLASPGVKSKSKMAKIPPSPYDAALESRKGSTASPSHMPLVLGADEEDLSSKPRCQRCRKSKKGCDRQRPCQRCVDAGIGIDGCISEEEENGRKGRFGRHMGVPVKKLSSDSMSTLDQPSYGDDVPVAGNGMNSADEKSKKRKR